LSHHCSVFSQFLKLVPRHEFAELAKTHHQGRRLRSMSRWSQFVALSMGQLSGRHSLRDVVLNMAAQRPQLYHLGIKPVARSSLARVNERQPYVLYEALFGRLYERCRGLAPRHRLRFKNKLYSLDASLIDLSLKVFPWAHYALGKAAMKLHVGLDHDGYLPAFATITEGRVSDMEVARTLRFAKGSMLVFDKGYPDYDWFKSLTKKGIFFVTRARSNIKCETIKDHQVVDNQGVESDQTIRLTGTKAQRQTLPKLRRVTYTDQETGKRYVFLSNVFHLGARTIADIYKARWQVELFFKWIKQNLKIKAFLGTSKNAILTQIWVALCVTLLLAYLKLISKTGQSAQAVLRLLQLNLFLRRNLFDLVTGRPPDPPQTDPRQQVLPV
jgi:putative transposase